MSGWQDVTRFAGGPISVADPDADVDGLKDADEIVIPSRSIDVHLCEPLGSTGPTIYDSMVGGWVIQMWAPNDLHFTRASLAREIAGWLCLIHADPAKYGPWTRPLAGLRIWSVQHNPETDLYRVRFDAP